MEQKEADKPYMNWTQDPRNPYKDASWAR
jgi:hypothetical protein